MKNCGTTTWATTGAAPYNLGSQNPQDNGVWGTGRVGISGQVPAGQEYTFSFNVVAPIVTTLTAKNFQWRMVHDAVAWFGSLTPNVVVTVIPPSVVVPNLPPVSTKPVIYSFTAENYRATGCGIFSTSGNCYYVMYGGTLWLSWTTNNVGQCEATANPSFPTTARWQGWSGRVPTVGNRYVIGPFLSDPGIPKSYTLTLTCCAGPAITCTNQPDKTTRDLGVRVGN
jgi:hypothetical protein